MAEGPCVNMDLLFPFLFNSEFIAPHERLLRQLIGSLLAGLSVGMMFAGVTVLAERNNLGPCARALILAAVYSGPLIFLSAFAVTYPN